MVAPLGTTMTRRAASSPPGTYAAPAAYFEGSIGPLMIAEALIAACCNGFNDKCVSF